MIEGEKGKSTDWIINCKGKVALDKDKRVVHYMCAEAIPGKYFNIEFTGTEKELDNFMDNDEIFKYDVKVIGIHEKKHEAPVNQ